MSPILVDRRESIFKFFLLVLIIKIKTRKLEVGKVLRTLL